MSKHTDVGQKFEKRMINEINNYLDFNNLKGLAYHFPEASAKHQLIDVLVDSSDIQFLGIECKSVWTDALDDGKVYFNKISHTNSRGVNQFIKQHGFLCESCRTGILAFELRDSNEIYLIPHKIIYKMILRGERYISLSQIVTEGFDWFGSESFIKFLEEECES